MIETDRLVAYLAACSILALTPGPGILYVMTRTLAGGTREGVLSSVGTFVGGFAHVLAAALGLSAILATSALAFQSVKYAGAAYLIYLGIQMIRRSGHLEVADAPPPKGSPSSKASSPRPSTPKPPSSSSPSSPNSSPIPPSLNSSSSAPSPSPLTPSPTSSSSPSPHPSPAPSPAPGAAASNSRPAPA